MRVEIKRSVYSEKQVTGKLTVINDKNEVVFTCHTLELADNNNAPKTSCIPPAAYKVEKRTSPKYGKHFWIKDVPNRAFILIHHGNYHTDILGCVLVGKSLVDINGDGYKDVTESKGTMKSLLSLLPEKFDLKIVSTNT